MNKYLLVEKVDSSKLAFVNTSNGLVTVRVIENPYEDLLDETKCRDFSVVDLNLIHQGDILITQGDALLPVALDLLNVGNPKEGTVYEGKTLYLLNVQNVLHKNEFM